MDKRESSCAQPVKVHWVGGKKRGGWLQAFECLPLLKELVKGVVQEGGKLNDTLLVRQGHCLVLNDRRGN